MEGSETLEPPLKRRRQLIVVAAAACLYTATAVALSAMQFHNLRAPHGDTGMYEEHLWNTWQGKGFRSQLDDGRLFFGEHFEFIHLLLLPAYVLYPSLVTLYLFESAALASGSFAVWMLARRLGAPGAALPLALAWLLYFPLQYLDFEVTWKNFRPESFGAPLVLFAILALESRRRRAGAALFALSYTAKEEFAIVGAAVGVFFLARGLRPGGDRGDRLAGAGMAVGSALFLAWVLTWFLPYFRGEQAHYTSYYQSLGDSPREILVRVAADPGVVLKRALRPAVGWFLLLLLGPLAFLPLASPMRLAVAAPTLAYLALADRDELIQPWFHFHGPLIPVLFWAAVGGAANLARFASAARTGWVVFVFCLASGAWFGRLPNSLAFYDPAMGSPRRIDPGISVRPDWRSPLFLPEGAYWRDVYAPDARSRAFARAREHVHPEDRVAATDYVRAHFTHCRAAHDYPTFRKHVSIDDVDVIVLDKTEGYWGRGESNPDQALLQAMVLALPPGSPVTVRGRAFQIEYHDPYFLVARRADRQ